MTKSFSPRRHGEHGVLKNCHHDEAFRPRRDLLLLLSKSGSLAPELRARDDNLQGFSVASVPPW